MADTATAFAIEPTEGVSVHIDDSSDDATFTLTVLRGGEAIETHEGVTADSVVDLGSEHFTATAVDVPTLGSSEEPGQQSDEDD